MVVHSPLTYVAYVLGHAGEVRFVALLPLPAVESVRQLGVVGGVNVARRDPLLEEQAILVIISISTQM